MQYSAQTPATLVEMPAEKTTLTGSCKCGFVKYTLQAKVDGSGAMSVSRCNCTFCQKLGTTNYYCDGPEDFQLLSPASLEELGTYAPRVKTCPRRFCKECGNHVLMNGYYELPNIGRRDMFVVNIATLDQPQAGLDLNNVKIEYYDGLNGNQMKGTQSKPFPGGLV